MNAADVIGYVYAAAVHCVDCATNAAACGIVHRVPPLSLVVDVHGMALDLVDSEGNAVAPVFADGEGLAASCDTCGARLVSP